MSLIGGLSGAIMHEFMTHTVSIEIMSSVSLSVAQKRLCFYMYTVSGKKVPLYFCPQLCEMLIDFKNPLTDRISGELVVN